MFSMLKALSPSKSEGSESVSNPVTPTTPCKRTWTLKEDNRLQTLINLHGNDWKTITENMPDRSSKQCRERWTNVLNPCISKAGFTAEEDTFIIETQQKLGNKWSEIAHMLKNRSDVAVKNRFAKLTKNSIDFKPNKYLSQEHEAAIALMEFPKIASLDDSSHSSLSPANSNEYQKDGKNSIKRTWHSIEDICLKQYVTNYGENNWKHVNVYLPLRTIKQCRERWTLTLDPKIKRDEWTTEEDEIILNKQKVIGNKWVDIAKLLPGRVDIAVKNRFFKIKNAESRKTSLDRDNGDEYSDFDVSSQDNAPQTPSNEHSYVIKHPKKRLLDSFSQPSSPTSRQPKNPIRSNNIDEAETDGASSSSSIESSNSSIISDGDDMYEPLMALKKLKSYSTTDDKEVVSKELKDEILQSVDNKINLQSLTQLFLQQPGGLTQMPFGSMSHYPFNLPHAQMINMSMLGYPPLQNINNLQQSSNPHQYPPYNVPMNYHMLLPTSIPSGYTVPSSL